MGEWTSGGSLSSHSSFSVSEHVLPVRMLSYFRSLKKKSSPYSTILEFGIWTGGKFVFLFPDNGFV